MLGPIVLTATLLLDLVDGAGLTWVPREVEFPFQDEQRLVGTETHAGKLWRSHGLPEGGSAVPLVIFVHGILNDGRRHHWLSEDPSGPWDARPFVEEMVDAGQIAPLVVAVPSQNNGDAYDPSRVFEKLDFDAFLSAVDAALAPHQRVDRTRVVVFGHSASACYTGNGSFAVLDAKTFTARALLAVDGCLSPESATLLTSTERVRDVVVAYQDQVWNERPFGEFLAAWEAGIYAKWPHGERLLDKRVFERAENAHMELMELTARRWLPVFLPPTDGVSWTAAVAGLGPTTAAPALAVSF